MKHLVYAHRHNVALLIAMYRWCFTLVAGFFSPDERRDEVQRPRRPRLPRAGAAVIVLALIAQIVMLWMLGELIDLSISLMELWAELARKHLELTL